MAALDVASASRLTRSWMINVPSAWVREHRKICRQYFLESHEALSKENPLFVLWRVMCAMTCNGRRNPCTN
jgi:hypothetical protein